MRSAYDTRTGPGLALLSIAVLLRRGYPGLGLRFAHMFSCLYECPTEKMFLQDATNCRVIRGLVVKWDRSWMNLRRVWKLRSCPCLVLS